MLRRILIIALVLCSCDFALADSIALKPSVRLAAGTKLITLADIAELQGESALALAGLPIADLTPGQAVDEISIAAVRQKLDAAGAHWGIINLSGKSVIVRSARAAESAPPLAMTPVDLVPQAGNADTRDWNRDDLLASEFASEATLRGTIASLVLSNLQLQPGDLRLTFDRTDAQLLNTPVHTARFEVQPLTSFNSDRIDFAVRTWIDGKVQKSQYISAGPLLRIKGATLRHDVHKDHSISQDDLVPTELWLPPSQAGMAASPVNAVGRIALKNMKQGETLRHKNIRRDALIKRGELVIVRCLVGGVVISLQAEARGDGAEGELIELRKQGERETFLATVSKRGEAVLDLSRKS